MILHLLLLISWMVLLGWLSLMSSPPQVPGLFGWDKLQHAVAYGLLAWLMAYVMLSSKKFRPSATWWSAGLCALLFGAGMELLQQAMHAGRAAEWQDLVADALGILLACVIFRQTIKIKSH